MEEAAEAVERRPLGEGRRCPESAREREERTCRVAAAVHEARRDRMEEAAEAVERHGNKGAAGRVEETAGFPSAVGTVGGDSGLRSACSNGGL